MPKWMNKKAEGKTRGMVNKWRWIFFIPSHWVGVCACTRKDKTSTKHWWSEKMCTKEQYHKQQQQQQKWTSLILLFFCAVCCLVIWMSHSHHFISNHHRPHWTFFLLSWSNFSQFIYCYKSVLFSVFFFSFVWL